ncbi:endo alpha-1,4 polygalactosaminidase [Sanguibacter suaedae]|uniref:Endo alpha-1,4 polygalactosaminidase n=1 Tax=Sanguibacter suaedae TaxID=2795737 RepID=A0A934IDB2_9MICO|nr:endo alpha-1,4 polygalactosaminidase [Sanguibacter suaedae]MBI9115731.1 endo alpha-1,4 polygalactosaminidase [Sanguibacter suaedae]
MITSPRPARSHLVRLAAATVAVFGLAGCVGGETVVEQLPAAQAVSAPDLVPFPDDAVGDYQLGGAYEPAPGVTLVVRDSTDDPTPGLYNVCYVNGFQTQPGESEELLAENPDLILHDASGEPVADPGWPDEYVLDISTDAARQAVAARAGEILRTCADRGYDAAEIDNLDSYLRSGGALDIDDATAAARLIVEQGAALGLVVGQKNTVELAERGRDDIGFGFAVVEECAVWDECDVLTEVYGGQVLAVEYTDEGDFTAACATPGRPADMILRDRDLVTPDDDEYVYERC